MLPCSGLRYFWMIKLCCRCKLAAIIVFVHARKDKFMHRWFLSTAAAGANSSNLSRATIFKLSTCLVWVS